MPLAPMIAQFWHKELIMDNENTQDYFPRKRIYNCLEDIQLRERIIEDNLKFITMSRQAIEKLLQAWENPEICEEET